MTSVSGGALLSGPWEQEQSGTLFRKEVFWDEITAEGTQIENGGFESQIIDRVTDKLFRLNPTDNALRAGHYQSACCAGSWSAWLHVQARAPTIGAVVRNV